MAAFITISLIALYIAGYNRTHIRESKKICNHRGEHPMIKL
ncbi:hypothetical protein [Loigolactobacillus coryniformis]|nr:hypothetical protein [Loigolactobacillus coryniformis]